MAANFPGALNAVPSWWKTTKYEKFVRTIVPWFIDMGCHHKVWNMVDDMAEGALRIGAGNS